MESIFGAGFWSVMGILKISCRTAFGFGLVVLGLLDIGLGQEMWTHVHLFRTSPGELRPLDVVKVASISQVGR